MSGLLILIEGALATAILWGASAALALVLSLVLAFGLMQAAPGFRVTAYMLVNLSRGIPTSLYVLLAGVAAMHLPLWPGAPIVFFGTLPMFQVVAVAVCLALAFGSAGHIAVIFLSSWEAVPKKTQQQFSLLDLGLARRIGLALTECAPTFLPPLSARLIHHLHNTAFASLFPVVDLFGVLKGAADTSARVLFYVSLGALGYVLLSWGIWLGLRRLELALAPQVRLLPARAAS